MRDDALYVHPLCYSSYKLIKGTLSLLEEKRVRVVLVDNPVASGALESTILSVPYLVIGGKPAAVDPLDEAEARSLLEGGSAIVYEAWKMMARSILASGYLTTLSIVHGPEALPRLLPRSFIEAALRSNHGGHSPEVAYTGEFWERVWRRLWKKAPTVVAYNYARHAYWSLRALGRKADPRSLREHLESEASLESIAQWIISMSSLGRVGNPLSFEDKGVATRLGEAAERALEVLKTGEVAEWIAGEEQPTIESDASFWEALGRMSMQSG